MTGASVNRLARLTNMKYGADLAFIAPIKRIYVEHVGMSEREFDDALVEASRSGYVALERADLPAAMDRTLIRESRVQRLNAEYHFVRVPSK